MDLALSRRTVTIREVHDRGGRFAKGLVERIASDADDGVRRLPNRQAAAQGLAGVEIPRDERLVDDGLRRFDAIAERREVLPGHERNLHRLQVAGRDGVRQRAIQGAIGASASFEREWPRRQPVDVERDLGRNRRRLHFGHGGQLVQQSLGELPDLRHLHAAAADIVRSQEHALPREARMRVLRLAKTLEKQPRRDQHDHGERHFDRHQHAAEPAGWPRRAASPQRRLRIDPRELERRRGAKHHRARQPETDRKQQTPAVQAGLKPHRKLRRQERHRSQRARAPHRDEATDHRRRQPEHGVLDQEEPDDAPRAGADGEPDADFAVTRARPRENQVRRVAAHRQQKHEHDALQQRQPLQQQALRPARRTPEREHVSLHAAIRLGVRLRELTHRRPRPRPGPVRASHPTGGGP